MKKYIDSLTGLNNMFFLFNNYHNYINYERTYVISFNLKEVKKVNDECGKDMSDLCIVMFADIISKIFSDSLLIRRGGDEFIIITYYSTEIITIKIKEINQKINEACINQNIPLFSFCSGIKKYDMNLKETLFKADLTMFHANKENNLFDFYDESLLKEGIVNNNFLEKIDKLLCYSCFSHTIEDIYDIKGEHKILTEISTSDDNFDLINKREYRFFSKSNYLKNYDLNNLNKVITEIIPNLDKNQKYLISVHVETLQLHGDNFINYIKDIIDKNKIIPKNVCLNVKISDNIKLSKKLLDLFIQLKAINIGICIDKFTCRFNSFVLSLISTLSIDYVKMDKFFLIKAMNETKSKVILINFVRLLLDMGISPIFIDIKTSDEREFIEKISHKCLMKGLIKTAIN